MLHGVQGARHLARVEAGLLEHGVVDRVPERPASPARTAAGRAPRARAPRGSGCRAARSPSTWRRDLDRARGAAPTGRPPTTRRSPRIVTDMLAADLGVLVDLDRLDVGDAVVEVELHHPVLLAEVEVDRARVDLLEGPAGVDRAHEAAVELGDAELLRRARAQAEARRRRAPSAPVGPAVAEAQPIGVHQLADAVVQGVAPPGVVVGRQRLLVGGAGQLRAAARWGWPGSPPPARAPGGRPRAGGSSATGRAGRCRPPARPPTAPRRGRPARPAATSRRSCPGSR